MKKLNNIGIKRLLCILLAVVMVCNLSVHVFADEANENDFEMTSAIYTASDYSDTPLVMGDTSAETILNGWEHDTDRYLKVDLSNLSQESNSTYQVVIKMQPVVYTAYIPNVSGATYEFEENEPLSVNTNATYTPLEHSGTITYTLDKGASMISIALSLRYDNALWNKMENVALGDEAEPLVSVSLVKVTEDPTDTDDLASSEILQELILSKAYTGTAMNVNGSMGIYRESRPNASNSSGTIVCGYDERVMIGASQMGSQNYSDGHYYKELTVEIDLPRYEKDDVTHYMSLEDLSFYIPFGEANITQTQEDGKITIVATDIYYKSNSLLRFYLKYPETVKDLEDIVFTGGNLTINGDGNTILSKSMHITMKTVKDPDVGKKTHPGAVNIRNLDTVQRLGTYGLHNRGGASGEFIVRMEFDANDTADMHVTSIQLMPDCVQEYITVTYTLVDEDGQPYANGAEFTHDVKNPFYQKEPDAYGMKAPFYRSMLKDAEHRKYYFKTISYKIQSIPEDTNLYHSGAIAASYSGGTFWGYVDTATPSQELATKITVDDVDENQYPDTSLSAMLTVKLDDTMNVPYGMSDPTVAYSASTPTIDGTKVVQAGESFTIGGTVLVVGYPYTSNNVLKKIQIGVLLPAGISINEETILLNKKKVDATVSKQQNAVNGRYLWIVEFPETTRIGYYSESMSGLSTGSSMTFNMTLNTDTTVSSYNLNMDEIVFAAGYQANNGSSGSYEYYLADEPQGYDLNRNGVIDKVAKFKTNKSISIQAAPAQLEISDGLRKADTVSSANSQLDHYADCVIYDLDITCKNGGTADDFFYFIPVPRAYENDTDFVKAAEVGLEMRSAAMLQTTGTPLQILYTTDTGLTYKTAQSATVTWLTEEQVTDWTSVTLMKIILADGYTKIENGSTNLISVPLYFAKENSINETVTQYDYAAYAGTKVKWNGKGFYHYINGANIYAGDVATYGVTVELQYTAWEQKEVILTAAKNRETTVPNAYKAEVEVEVPFKNAQTYTLAVVSPTDVNLVGSKTTISDENSNTDFGITVSVNGGKPVDILTESIETQVGTAPANGTTKLVFELYNGDALSDIVRERYVEIKLVGNNGVIIPVKIRINREMSLADNATSAIQGGKEYLQVSGKATETTVSVDSAFTAQYVIPDYIGSNYNVHQLTFSNPAKGTSIVMIDWADATSPRYYHYTLGANENNVPLSKFKEMGLKDTYYQQSTETTPIEERLLFVVDLPDDGSAVNGTIGLVVTPKAGNESSTTALTYKVADKRTFSLGCADTDQKVLMEEPITFNYATTTSGHSESRYNGRQAALVIEATDASGAGNNSITADSKLVVGDTSYYLNADGNFIVPIGELKSGSCTMSYVSSGNATAKLSASLWVAANADALHPLLGDKVSDDVVISVNSIIHPSIKATHMSDRLLSREDLKKQIEFSYQTANVSGYTTTLEVQLKEGTGYRPITTVLNTVNGNPPDAGVYTVGTGGTLKLKFSEQTDPGTYRLVLKAEKDNETVLEVPYNFIVKED